MPDWATFAAFVGVLVALLLILSRSSRRLLERATVVSDRSEATASAEAPASGNIHSTDSPAATPPVGSDVSGEQLNGEDARDASGSTESRDFPEKIIRSPGQDSEEGSTEESGLVQSSTQLSRQSVDTPLVQSEQNGVESETQSTVTQGVDSNASENGTLSPENSLYLTTRGLYANIVVSQGLFLAVLAVVVWWTNVPVVALGIDTDTISGTIIGVGLATGAALYVSNELVAAVATRLGVTPSTDLAEALAPDSVGGWVFLLVVLLPLIAGFEEVLFRGVLIGALAMGFEISPWILAVGSSVVFGLGHGAQGRTGIVVTGLLGFGLATLFIISGSLMLVIIAHYVVNALEFGVREAAAVN